ncbi:MAG: hypothetical protein A3C43_07690 [Candidatus Schekmanbacteria bacterium RIFCSPHIGHO2_02_FULL_38_11]|uniref:Methyltransferase type 12 domain-containing protein n=1 Tax=Candidatus Schekmanbacteria bacterium RIFCSPLOWO2_12_FULL_38_15 TaxID=1817883 RepID=A0A1F7SG69_9BACT|nr:MAG: hypothetical protein A2043_11170 [Candidatus Schekmanbacteria bacterium GWA2_38_9]OGL48917.1 MAG: hypothetical protein A3C43_07690 [Candidatus Schekmanbacteria bacterium RIFCSPHIGHO2_02_FULL_38_11]OGL49878.1 MAG: hypothetical protein A3H37_09730 [Candidatus Schekmanbacteria bacterium RIFCSPLOWO2_02_FULL_38_14]OGL52782.1 MAG: hypothetical protein A3G31_00070 [Candidatus Schekmanbacteria bacterium RIFCSPLOWO2_12_FULL_38_15]
MRRPSLGGDPGAWKGKEVSQYDTMQNIVIPKKDEMLDVIVSMIPFKSDKPLKIMEIGSGLGALTQRLLGKYPKAGFLCLDGSEEMIRNGGERLRNFQERIRFQLINFNNPKWINGIEGKLDLVCSSLTLHYLATRRRKEFFKEVSGILKKNGMLIYSCAVRANSPFVQKIFVKVHRQYLLDKIFEVMGMRLTDKELDEKFKKRRDKMGINPMTPENHLEYMRKAKFSKAEFIWKHRHYAIFMGVK